MVMVLQKGRKEHEASIQCSKAKRLVITREGSEVRHGVRVQPLPLLSPL